MREKLPWLAGLAIAVLVILSMSMFTVDQRQYAIVRQFGEIKNVIGEPGLNFKWPLIQDVRYFDKRIQTFETTEPERFITSEKKNVLVDLFVKWRIFDVNQFYISVGGDEARAKIRLEQTINAGLREEFGKRTVHEVVSGERDKIMEDVRTKADQDARKIGVQILDVRVKRVDLPNEVSESVYRRMEAERKRDADKQREIIVAEAYRDAQRIKGEGDAKAAATYAQAFGQNPEFYAFYRSLDAYRQSFKSKGDLMVIDPSSDFFRYLKGSGSAGKPAGR
jgi:membrane protease subunit HflC